jgi:Acetyltransferase (GNAT) domain
MISSSAPVVIAGPDGGSEHPGYCHRAYAASFAHLGKPRFLPRSGGWLIERPVVGSPFLDAMGCYPLFCCDDWTRLDEDLVDISSDLVSVCLVTDPFGSFDIEALQCHFHRFFQFKTHFVADMSLSPEQLVSNHHQYYARWAMRRLHLEVHEEPIRFLDEWVNLYSELVRRHNIKGVAAFSREAFALQLSVPGMVLFRAVHGDETVGAQLWCRRREVAYSHLTACSEHGYSLRAAYALHSAAIGYFRNEVAWLDFGGSAGLRSTDQDGLAIFKRGWASGMRDAYLCGRILDPAKYAQAMARARASPCDYFPEYRRGEFGSGFTDVSRES